MHHRGPQATAIAIFGAIIGDRPVQGGWCWPIVGDSEGRDATDDSLEEARNADPGGQLERPKKRRQSGGWMSSVACDQRCISKR
jgi:hypothetical protein